MSPLTPTKMYDGRLAVQLPPNLLPAFVYLSEAALTHPEIAAFPTFYLAAWAGNEDAIKRVLELVFISHYAGVHHARTKDEIATANCIIRLGNALAEAIENKSLPSYDDDAVSPEAASPKKGTNPAPVKHAEHKRTKPATDPKLKFQKPGEMKHAR